MHRGENWHAFFANTSPDDLDQIPRHRNSKLKSFAEIHKQAWMQDHQNEGALFDGQVDCFPN